MCVCVSFVRVRADLRERLAGLLFGRENEKVFRGGLVKGVMFL